MSRPLDLLDHTVVLQVELHVDIDMPDGESAAVQGVTSSTETGSSFMEYFLFVQDKF